MSRISIVFLTLVALCAAGVAAIDSELLFRGGETVSLRGLQASQSTQTDLTLVNLAQSGNRCTLALADGNGVRIGPAMTLTLRSLEERPFANVFEHLAGAAGVADARATVSCSRDFYTYGTLTDRSGNRVELISPEAASAAVQALPAPARACPAAADCFDAQGVVHVPDPEDPVGRVAFPAPAGTTRRLSLSLDVKVGEWYPDETNGKHLIYWFVVNKNIDMPGLLYFRGPGKNQAFARHGIGLTHPQKIKMIRPFAAEIGHTYRVENDYDMAGGLYTVRITDLETGKLKVTLRSKPNRPSYTIKPNSRFLVDMGFPEGKESTEVPSYGWEYSNVHIEAYPQ